MNRIITISLLVLLLGCSSDKNCNNRFAFTNCGSEIPIIEIDYSNHPDSIRKEIIQKFDYNPCDSCSWVYFKIPFNIENKPGFLKVMVNYDYPVCNNCPVPIRLRYYYTISIAHHKQIIANGFPIHVDSLYDSIKTYLSNVGNENRYFPEGFNQVNFKLIWDVDTKNELIESVLNQIYKAQLGFIESKISYSNRMNFCKLSNKEIGELKGRYPLRIEFDLGIFRPIAPPDKKIEIDDKDLIKEDIEPENEL